MSDFRLVESPPLPPAACCVTGRADGPLVDTNIADNFGNELYLHPVVIEQAGELLGLVPRVELERAHEEHAAAGARIAELEAQVAALEELRRSVAVTMQHGGTIDRKGHLQLKGLTFEQREKLGVAS